MPAVVGPPGAVVDTPMASNKKKCKSWSVPLSLPSSKKKTKKSKKMSSASEELLSTDDALKDLLLRKQNQDVWTEKSCEMKYKLQCLNTAQKLKNEGQIADFVKKHFDMFESLNASAAVGSNNSDSD